MRYIIPQDKLDKIIFKYLDLNLKGLEKKKARFYKGFVFAFPNEEYGVLGWNSDDSILHIDFESIDLLTNIFSLSPIDSEMVIVRWFESRFNLVVLNSNVTAWLSKSWLAVS